MTARCSAPAERPPLDSPPIRTELPIDLAALGPQMLDLAAPDGRNGVILNLTDADPGRRGRQRCPRVREGGGARSGVGRDRLCNALLPRGRRPGRRGGARCRPALCHASRGAAAVRRTGRRPQPAGRAGSLLLAGDRAAAADAVPAAGSRRIRSSMAARTSASPGQASTRRRAWTCQSCSRCRRMATGDTRRRSPQWRER